MKSASSAPTNSTTTSPLSPPAPCRLYVASVIRANIFFHFWFVTSLLPYFFFLFCTSPLPANSPPPPQRRSSTHTIRDFAHPQSETPITPEKATSPPARSPTPASATTPAALPALSAPAAESQTSPDMPFRKTRSSMSARVHKPLPRPHPATPPHPRQTPRRPQTGSISPASCILDATE